MTAAHVVDRLAALADGVLDAPEARRVCAHLEQCESCAAAWSRHLVTARVMGELPAVSPPDSVLAAIEGAVGERGEDHQSSTGVAWLRPRWIRVAAAIAAALVLVVSAWVATRRAATAPWDIVRIDVPSGPERLDAGKWIVTDDSSTARISVGQIGTVDIAPGTRLRVVGARPDEHRLRLTEGEISAEIVAPPRVFFVETPTSTVVDLGCAYTLTIEPEGFGRLRVTEGWASLEWQGRESLVPAGASCPTRPSVGPGTPLFDDASPQMRDALLDFDFGSGSAAALDIILQEARVRDTLTLWHLLVRVDDEYRQRVFDRIVALTPLPAGIDPDAVLALDDDALRQWREELAWTW